MYKNKKSKEEILNRIKTEVVTRNCPRETIGLLRNGHPQLIITKKYDHNFTCRLRCRATVNIITYEITVLIISWELIKSISL